MPQLTYDLEKTIGYAGMKIDTRPDDIESFVAAEEIPLGSAVVKCKAVDLDKTVRLPNFDGVVITDDAGTFTAGTIAATIVYNAVNGASVSTTYSQAFSTDKATSMAALAAKIAANTGVDTCVYSDGSHTITLVANADYNLSLITVDVTGITGAMTISSVAYSSNDKILGLSVHTHKEQEEDGTVSYIVNEMVSVMRKGAACIYVEEAITSNASVYVRAYTSAATKNRGQFLGTSTAETISTIHLYGKISLSAGWQFKKTVSGAGITVIECNLPQ
jgi:hypothetical protein